MFLYREMKEDDQLFEKKEKKLKNAKKVAVFFIPIFCLIFIFLFFGIGLSKTLLTK